MSTALKTQPEVLPSLETLAHDIHRDYQAAMHGMRSYVAMGIRLHIVKESLLHGQFMRWCDKNLTITHRHIGNAMSIAATLCEIAKIEIGNALPICDRQIGNALDISEKPQDPLFELIEGTTHRRLSLALKEYRNDPTEDAAKNWCEDRWAKNSVDRDNWEPRVLSGEITYIYAKIGMLGADNTKEQPRREVAYDKLLLRNAGSYVQIWKHWESLPETTRHDGLAKLQEAFANAPAEVKKSLASILK
jgi:hypothetical protein